MRLLVDMGDGSALLTLADPDDLLAAWGADRYAVRQQIVEDVAGLFDTAMMDLATEGGRIIEEPTHIAEVLETLPIVKAARLLENI